MEFRILKHDIELEQITASSKKEAIKAFLEAWELPENTQFLEAVPVEGTSFRELQKNMGVALAQWSSTYEQIRLETGRYHPDLSTKIARGQEVYRALQRPGPLTTNDVEFLREHDIDVFRQSYQ